MSERRLQGEQRGYKNLGLKLDLPQVLKEQVSERSVPNTGICSSRRLGARIRDERWWVSALHVGGDGVYV